ncbi:hypothetical protein SDC9_151459 [bioreactor metagenome]|uniref:Uncharacterized protein n=1 Tax=bioreactor metagenome TaxID=1076179 RepID=A0A645EUP3_9ZZZZ
MSGFFISNTDGYESTLTPETVNSMSVEDAMTILNSEGNKKQSEAAVGKIITDFNWYYLAVMDSSMQNKITKNKMVTFSFPIASGQKIAMNVKDIRVDEKDPSKCLVLFSCDNMIEELNLMRFTTADLIFNSFEGIRIPSSAIRIVDGNKGVYVLIGTQAKFKKINILYEQPDYVVAETKDPMLEKVMPVTSDDEVIVGSKDLYDGKIVK